MTSKVRHIPKKEHTNKRDKWTYSLLGLVCAIIELLLIDVFFWKMPLEFLAFFIAFPSAITLLIMALAIHFTERRKENEK